MPWEISESAVPDEKPPAPASRRRSLGLKAVLALIAECGDRCHYCAGKVKIRTGRRYEEDDATVDHVVPRSKGGTDARGNLALACRKCNKAKEDRDLADFLADPRPSCERFELSPFRRSRGRRKRVAFVPVPAAPPVSPVPKHPAYKAYPGTLAHAIEAGDVHENGVYRRAKPDDAEKLKAPKSARKMTAMETARFLRESARRAGKPWPLA